jgi:hypothetical protein
MTGMHDSIVTLNSLPHNGYVNRAAPEMLGVVEALAGAAPVQWVLGAASKEQNPFQFYSLSIGALLSFITYAT